jgi:hypothetical protein
LISISCVSHACYIFTQFHLPWFDIIVIFSEGYKLWSSSLFNCVQSPVNSSILGPSILTTLFLSAFSLCFSHRVRHQVSHSQKTKSQIIVLYIFVLMPIDRSCSWYVVTVIVFRLSCFLTALWFFAPEFNCTVGDMPSNSVFMSLAWTIAWQIKQLPIEARSMSLCVPTHV